MFSNNDLADAFALGHEVATQLRGEGETPRLVTYYADCAVAETLGIPVHEVSRLFRPARVRRETDEETRYRSCDQIPSYYYNLSLLAMGDKSRTAYVNADLEPTPPTFVSQVTMTANPRSKGHDSLSPSEYLDYLYFIADQTHLTD